MHDEPTLPLGDYPQAAPGTPALRDTWGPFRLLARVGSGGFGEVYRAWDPNLEREVALKLLLPGVVGGEEEYKAMLREARAMASVLHPNIVHVYGIDRHDDRVGFWTDFVKGKTLSALLGSQGPFGYREAALIGIDVSRALSAVHRAGLLHRDIKAENVMREEGGRILLMDFGLSAGERSLTGQIAGTPNYMAPELFEGGPATVCTDIYAMGVLLYYLVIAEYPARLTGLTIAQAKLALAHRTPLMDLRSDLPEPFLRAVRSAMDLDPARRFSSAGQLADSLAESLGTGMATPAVPYVPVSSYGHTLPTPAQTPQFTPVTPPSRSVPPPPPPPPSRAAVGPLTWSNLFGIPAWFGGLSRGKKWAIVCVVIVFGQRTWEGIMPKHQEPVSTKTTATSAKVSNDDDDSKDDDDKQAEDLLRKAYKSANIASALKAFQQLIADQPDSATAQAGLGSAYFKQFHTSHDKSLLDLAKSATNKALALDKDQKLAEPHVTMANIEVAEGQASQAMQQVQKAISIDPKSAAAYGAMANVYQAEGKKADALTAVKKAIDLAPDQAEWPLQLASYYEAAGNAKEASAQWQKSISLDSDNADAYWNMGHANMAADKVSDAAEDFEKAVDIEPTAAGYKSLSAARLLEGNADDAVEAGQKAVKLSSLDSESWGILARAQRINGDHDAAAKSYAKAIDLAEGERLSATDNPQLLVQLATYYAATGKTDLSLTQLRKALSIAPKINDIDYQAAVAYMLLGQRAQAMPLVLRSLALGSHMIEIEHSPELAPLRSEPSVQALLGRRKGPGTLVPAIDIPAVHIPPVILPPLPPDVPRH